MANDHPPADMQQSPTRTNPRHRNADPSIADVEPADLLELLGDSYTRTVFRAVAEQPRSGREVAAATSISRATAFRRLNDLADAGLVTVEMVPDPDGHHHKQYRAVVADVTVQFDDNGFSVNVECLSNQQSSSKGRSYKYRLRND
jgi:DNA-binding HxlR family transcriptional regulator